MATTKRKPGKRDPDVPSVAPGQARPFAKDEQSFDERPKPPSKPVSKRAKD